MLLEGAKFLINQYQILWKGQIYYFWQNLVFLVHRHLAVNGGNGGVKNKMLNNGSIITRKKYVVQIYKIKLHTKNHVDWIKNEAPREV